MQAYSDPRRESDPHALPDLEVFMIMNKPEGPRSNAYHAGDFPLDDEGNPPADGWYYWHCFPGCMPDSEPYGPFDSAELALADAKEGLEG